MNHCIPTAGQWADSFVSLCLERRNREITRPVFRLELGKLEDLAARADAAGSWAVPRLPVWSGPLPQRKP